MVVVLAFSRIHHYATRMNLKLSVFITLAFFALTVLSQPHPNEPNQAAADSFLTQPTPEECVKLHCEKIPEGKNRAVCIAQCAG